MAQPNDTDTTKSPASTPRRRGSCLGRLVKGGLFLLILLAILIALIPTLLSSGPGTRFVEGSAASFVNGTLTIQDLGLSWTGTQTVRGLKIVDVDGKPAIDVDVTLNNGLVALARGDWKRADATLSGSVNAELRPDGSLNLADLVASPPPSSSSGSGSGSPSAPSTSPGGPMLPEGLDASLAITDLDITLVEQATRRTLTLSDLKGNASVVSGGDAKIALAGGSEFEGRKGTVALDGTIGQLIQADGRLRFKGATANLDATIENLALPLPQMLVDVKSLTAKVESADLTEAIKATLASTATLNGTTPSEIKADITAIRMLSDTGAFAFRPQDLQASVVATNVPTALMDPFLTDSPLVASRDIGPMVDTTVAFPGGGGDVAITLKAANLSLDGAGTVDAQSGALTVSRLVAETKIVPALLASAAGITAAAPVPVTATFDRLVLPGPDANGVRDLGGLSLRGRISLPGVTELRTSEVAATPAAGAAPTPSEALATLTDFVVNFDSTALRDGVTVAGGGGIEGGQITVDERVTNLVDSKGALDAANATVDGSIVLKGIATQRLLAILPPDTAAMAREILSAPIDATLTTAGNATKGEGTLVATSGGLRLEGAAALADRLLTVKPITAVVPATPALMARLQEGSESPVVLDQAATLTAKVQSFSITLDKAAEFMTSGPVVKADLSLSPASLSNVPGTSGSVGVRDFAGMATITPGARLGVAFDGGMKVAAGTAPLTTTTIKVDAQMPPADATAPNDAMSLRAAIDARELDVAALETLLGKERGSLTDLLGARGAIKADVVPQADGVMDVTVVPRFETATGELKARYGPTAIEVPSGSLVLNLSVAQLDRLLAPSPAAGAAPAPPANAPAIVFAAPLEVRVNLEGVSIDQKLIAGEPSDPTRTRGSLKATTSGLKMKLSSGEAIGFDGISASASVPRIDQGATFVVDGKGAAENIGAIIKVTGAARGLADSKGVLTTDALMLDLDATASQIPTIFLDKLQQFDGKLVAALGPTLNAKAKANGLSKTSGTMSARLDSANGFLDVPQIVSRENALRIEPSAPITAELTLTKELREKLLQSINPILADVRTTKQPIKVTIPSAVVPTDGNTARLDADLEMTVGEVEFDSGSRMLSFLELFNTKEAKTIPGAIEPLRVAVRQGQLRYDDFNIRIGRSGTDWKHTLKFFGDIDLVARPQFARAIKARYPADGLAKSIKEVPAAAGLLYAEIVFSGPLFDEQGNSKALEHKINFGVDLPSKPEDILKDDRIKKGIEDIFKALDKDKKK